MDQNGTAPRRPDVERDPLERLLERRPRRRAVRRPPADVLGRCYRDGRATPVTSFEAPTLTDLGVPGPLECRVALADGAEIRFTAEQVHALPMTLTLDNDNINGMAWDTPGGVALVEGVSRLTFVGGEVGYAHLERSARLETLQRPDG